MSSLRILVRLPPDVKFWLKEQTVLNASTVTAEIVRSIRGRMETTPNELKSTSQV